MNDLPRLRLYVGAVPALSAGLELALPEAAARHAQVRRVQPGQTLVLFDGQGNDWPAEILTMGRGAIVRVRVGEAPLADESTPNAGGNELSPPLHIALVMPAGDRMDFVIEKATELGAASLQPLVGERSVLRLAGERAERKREHWQALAVAACEQCGRRIVPVVQPVQALANWLTAGPATTGPRWLLSPRAGMPLARMAEASSATTSAGSERAEAWVLSGPEGGFSPAEEDAARAAGWQPVNLGPRVLRADTAPLAVLAWWGLRRG